MLELLIAVTVNWTRLQLKLFLVDETIGRVLLMLPVIAGMTRYVTGVRVSWYG